MSQTTLGHVNEEVALLISNIHHLNERAEAAFALWDIEAYEGACNKGDRYYSRLVKLVGSEQAKELVKNA